MSRNLRIVAIGAVTGVAATLTVLAGRAARRVGEERDAWEEELRLAAVRCTLLAQRDHELRNGLAGLAGATRMLGEEHADREYLESLVASELERLSGLLWSPDGIARPTPARPYAVEPVLRGLAALRRAAGTTVHLEVAAGLEATGSPESLAQVVTNLLANAERHAPGSPVALRATGRPGHVVVEVRDSGPGITPAREELVFAPGALDLRGVGRGVGMPLCRRLVVREGGSIAVRPPDPAAPGCRVVVELPAPARHAAATEPREGSRTSGQECLLS